MQTLTKPVKGLLVALGFGVTTPALAGLQPGSFMTKDGAEVTPILSTGFSSNDNFFMTPSETESRLVWNIAPSLKAVIDDGPNSYQLDLGTNTSFHNKDTTDNFTTVNVDTSLHQEFTSKHRLDIKASADWLSEARGSGLTEGQGVLFDELVKYQEQNASARYEYGAKSSKAQVALSTGYYNKTYDNFTAISQYRDYDKTKFGIAGYYSTQAASRTFLEITQENYRYDLVNPNSFTRDSDDLKVLVGLEWEATAVTSGSFKIGYQNKDFKSSQRENFSGLSWKASAVWKPLTYTSLQLVTSQAAKDPLLQGDFIKESVYGATWEHDWTDFITSVLSANYVDQDYTGDTNREDETKNVRVGLNYLANNFGMLSGYVDFVNKESTRSDIEFDRVIVGINFTFALKAN